jgi:subtilisin family serine protease
MLMPIQVFDNKHCSLSSIVAGVMYAVHHDADVVNISIGPSFKDLNMLPVEQQEQIARQQFKNVEKLWARLCTLAAKKNCILVFAAGNDDILSSVPPENRNQSSIVVTAVDKNLYPTNFTNYGPCSDISAPGKEIYSSFPRGSFQSCDGTSMAAPIVAGTIALMKSLKKDLTVLQARNVLYKTGADVYGNIPPMVLVDKALAGVQCGDFSVPNERQIRPVPDGNGDDSAAGKVHPVQEVDAPINQVPPQLSNETDYDAIRRQIDEYKKKIGELEKLLPNKK